MATSGGEKIKVEMRKYRGRDVLSARKWYLDEHEGKWFPTPRGINLTARTWREILPEILRLLELSEEEAKAKVKAKPPVLTQSKPEKAGKV